MIKSKSGASGRIARVYRNDGGGTFTDISAGLVGVWKQYAGSVAWGDYDDDDDLDILLSGLAESDQRTFELYRNDDLSTDVTLSKVVEPAAAAPGQTVTYTLSFSNIGGQVATQVVITDSIPVSITVTSVFSSGVAIADTGASPAYVWSVQDLNPGDSGIITITGKLLPTLPGWHIFGNTATIACAEATDSTTNNSGSAYVTVKPIPAIIVTKTASATSAKVSETITYTYRVTNTGNVTLDPVTAHDDRLGDITLNTTALAPGLSTSGILTYTVVESDLPGPLTNTVIVTGTPPWGPVVIAETSLALTIGQDQFVYLPLVLRNAP